MRSVKSLLPISIACLGVALALVIPPFGCSAHRTDAAQFPPDSEELPIEWSASGAWSHLSRPVRIVAYDRATLDQVPITEVPVDFSRQMVLVAGLGPNVGSEMGILISRVWREGARIRVQERRLHPGSERSPRPDRASPWAVVVVPRSELNIEGYTSRVPPGIMSD